MIPTDRLLIQVVPQLKPMRCGVSDHAINLARELRGAFGIDGAFAVLNSDEKCSPGFPVVHCAPSELLETCLSLSGGRAGAVLVHLSGYGYAADGAPKLLADALRDLRTSGRFRTAVYFHELFAGGMPWNPGFRYSRRQRKVVRRIAEECDLLTTSIEHFAEWLEQKTARQSLEPIQRLPVFSTVGEIQKPTPIAKRNPAIVVFGLSATRRRAYKQLQSEGAMLRHLNIKEVLDIGPESDVPSELSGIPVRRREVLSPADLSEELSETMFGFLSYASPFLARSGVLAAYSAHATIPVIAKSFSGETDGLKDGVQVLSPQTAKAAKAGGLELCSDAVWRWYSGHRLHAHAAAYANWLDRLEMNSDGEMRRTVDVKVT